MRSFILAGVIALGTTFVPANAANIVVNGSFESPLIDNPCCNTITAGNAFPGWDVTEGDVNQVAGTYASAGFANLALQGTQYLDLIGQSGAGGISQVLSTVVGQTYRFTFGYSHNLFAGLPSASGFFDVGGLSGTVTHSTGTNADLDWQAFTGTFTATSTSTLLSFRNLTGDGSAGLLLDDIVVDAVPEPGIWAMMIAGFGIVGGTLRRLRRKGAAALA